MARVLLVFCFSTVLANTKVYEISGTDGFFKGLYVETKNGLNEQTFQQLGESFSDGSRLFLFRQHEWSKKWWLGGWKEGTQFTVKFTAEAKWDHKSVPPENGWKMIKSGLTKALKVTERPSLLSSLEQTEASGGSLTSDGGIICLETNSKRWIMIASDKSKICDKRKYCQNSLDVEQRHKSCEKGNSEEQENSSTEEQPLTPKDTPQRPTQFTTKPTSGKPYKPLDNEPGIKIKEEKNKVFPIQTTPLSIDSGIPTIHNTFIFWH